MQSGARLLDARGRREPLMAPSARLVIAAAGDFHRGWLLSGGKAKSQAASKQIRARK